MQLVQIARGQWSDLRNLYRSRWPQGVVAYCLLETQISYPNLNKSFKVYCPNGNLFDGMIAVSDQYSSYDIFVHPLDNGMINIEQTLLYTNLINWNKGAVIHSACAEVVEALERLHTRLGINIKYYGGAIKYLMSRDSKPFENVVYPPNTYVGPLIPEHLSLVDKTWVFHSTTSHQMFKAFMDNGLTYVLYSAEDHTVLAWITINEAGAFTHLFCLEPHRRKGYAEFITKFAVNDLLKKGKDLLAYTMDDNVKPQIMFKKLGFEVIGTDQWLFMAKENYKK